MPAVRVAAGGAAEARSSAARAVESARRPRCAPKPSASVRCRLRTPSSSVPEVARAIHVHPQTVRYRLNQLRELFDLEDPEARFELLLVTRARGLGLGSWPQ